MDMVVLLWIGAEWSVVGVWVRTEYTECGSIIVDWCRMERCWCYVEDRTVDMVVLLWIGAEWSVVGV